ncbi:MAG: hypothetical protein NT154_06755 [Verrucomicrobia bacterium]|nr:hypothetical protein [Verrucomicrobiota bacterium]
MKTVIRTTSAGRKLGRITSIVTLRGGFAALAITLGCLLVLSATSSTASPKVGNPNPGIAPPNSQPLGSSYNDWAIPVNQWFWSIPTTETTPPTRVFGNMVVPPLAWLTGVTIPVTMKVGQWFFVPICFNCWANTPGDWGYDHPWDAPYVDQAGNLWPTYEAWAREQMKEYMDTFNPTSTIDGKPVQNINLYRMQTGLFDIKVPADNAWGSWLPAGTYGPCFSDGWFAILNPMTPGKHPVTNAIGEGLFVTYEITVTSAK